MTPSEKFFRDHDGDEVRKGDVREQALQVMTNGEGQGTCHYSAVC